MSFSFIAILVWNWAFSVNSARFVTELDRAQKQYSSPHLLLIYLMMCIYTALYRRCYHFTNAQLCHFFWKPLIMPTHPF